MRKVFKSRFNLSELVYMICSAIAFIYSILSVTGILDMFSDAQKDKEIHIIGIILSAMFFYLVVERPNIDQIRDALKAGNIESLKLLFKSLDPNLRDIFKEDLELNLLFYEEATQTGTINIATKERFAEHYVKALNRYHKATLFATSIPSKKYFWKNNIADHPVEAAIENFVKNGGKMERIFLLSKETDIDDPEVKEVLDFHKNKLKVKVFTICAIHVPKVWTETFFVVFEGKDANLAWSALVNSHGEVEKFKFTVNRNITASYRAEFKKLKKMKCCTEY